MSLSRKAGWQFRKSASRCGVRNPDAPALSGLFGRCLSEYIRVGTAGTESGTIVPKRGNHILD